MGAVQTFKPDLKYADFGTMGKTGFRVNQFSTYNKTEQKTGLKEALDPRTQTTQQFYLENGKRVNAPTAVIGKRTSYLETNNWTDNVFTGDKPDFQKDLTTKVKKRINKLGLSNAGKMKMPGLDDPLINKTERKESKTADSQRLMSNRQTKSAKPTTFSKIDANAAADQETQLVNLGHKQTLQGKVDLRKVRDIRRAIRRRYATRKNATNLFHAWDLKQQKKIDTDDILNMVSKMGIKINKDEAYVLLKSADINGDNNLNLAEFISLIHSTNEALDVDLQDLAPMNDALSNAVGKVGAIDRIQQKASGLYENRLDMQMRLFMQKSSQTIARDCLNEDHEIDGEKSYLIDKKKLKVILKHRLNLPEMLKNDTERIDKIIEEYIPHAGSEFVDYKTLLEDMRVFNYNIESDSSNHVDRKMISSNTQSEISEPQDTPRTMLTILDIQKVPFNKEEDIKNRSSKINRMLKKHFKTKEAFTRHLKDNVDVDKNGTIDLNEFQTLIINTLKDQIENSEVGRQDVEGFLSNFVYNKYGHTDINEVAPRVFASVEEYNRIIDHFRKPKPPPSTVNNGLIEGFEQNLGDKFYQQRIKTLADKIVDKAIGATHNKFQCFKSFD